MLLSFVAALAAFGIGYAVGRRKYDDVGAHVTARQSGVAFLVFVAVWIVFGVFLPEGDTFSALVGVARTLAWATFGYALGWGIGSNR